MGLGLPIVMGIVNQLGGTLQIEEDTGEGTSFAIVIPRVAGPEVKKGGVKPRQHVSSSADTPESFIEEESFSVEKQTILLVEDNVQLLSLLRSSFAAEYNVWCARNGKRAMEILSSKTKPEVIVSDVIMDELDGFALLEQVSKNERWKSIPFIFLTAKTEKEEKLKALSGGAVDFITKPFAIEELVAKIKSILRHRSAQKESDIKDIEKKISHVLRQGDAKDIRSVLEKYDLTQKERKIIELLHLGLQYKEISDKINLSIAAVRKRVHGIYRKFNVQNRTELFLVIEKDA
jgi:DNA-binding NarL/FixJ family response regulator